MQTAAKVGRKKESFGSGRVEFKADPKWIERATRYAESIGLNLSALIRMVVTERLETAEAERLRRRGSR